MTFTSHYSTTGIRLQKVTPTLPHDGPPNTNNLQTLDHLLKPILISGESVSAVIKAKRSISKAHYDKSSCAGHDMINNGEFVYARPPPRQKSPSWAYGRITDRHHARLYTINTPHSTIHRNKIDIRRAASPPNPAHAPPVLWSTVEHSLTHHHISKRLEPTTLFPSPAAAQWTRTLPWRHTPTQRAQLKKARVSYPSNHPPLAIQTKPQNPT